MMKGISEEELIKWANTLIEPSFLDKDIIVEQIHASQMYIKERYEDACYVGFNIIRDVRKYPHNVTVPVSMVIYKENGVPIESILHDWNPSWKTVATVIHFDEFGGRSGHPHKIYMPIGEDKDGCPVLNAKRDFNLKFFTFMNREYPARMRERGYPVLDCEIYEDMTEEEREQHKEKKKDYGLEGYEYKIKRDAEQEAQIKANEQLIDNQEEVLSAQKDLIAENDRVIEDQDGKITQGEQKLDSIHADVKAAEKKLDEVNADVTQARETLKTVNADVTTAKESENQEVYRLAIRAALRTVWYQTASIPCSWRRRTCYYEREHTA